jgi:hypothetical protein
MVAWTAESGHPYPCEGCTSAFAVSHLRRFGYGPAGPACYNLYSPACVSR